MQKEDKDISGLIHLLNIIPLWGIAFNGIIWYTYKDKSKVIVFNALQSIFFQIAFLIIGILGILFQFFSILVGYLLPQIGHFLKSANYTVLMIFLIIYIFFCLLGAWKTFSGEEFQYPYIGARLKKETAEEGE